MKLSQKFWNNVCRLSSLRHLRVLNTRCQVKTFGGRKYTGSFVGYRPAVLDLNFTWQFLINIREQMPPRNLDELPLPWIKTEAI